MNKQYSLDLDVTYPVYVDIPNLLIYAQVL